MIRSFLASGSSCPTEMRTALAGLVLVGALAAPALGEVVQLSSVAGGQGGFAIDGEATNDLAGFSVAAAGDVNADGLADIILGARTAASGTGRAYVVFGNANSTVVSLAALGTQGFQINGQTVGDNAGNSVAGLGDINGDGFGDVVVGAPLSDGGATNAGRAYVVFGKSTTTPVDLTSITIGAGGFLINNTTVNDEFGSTVAGAGDVNGDGINDILIGAPFADSPGPISNSGRPVVVFGSASTSLVQVSALGTRGFIINGEVANNQVGSAMAAAGDMNGDGLGDFALGSLAFNGVDTASGRAYLIFGRTASTEITLTALGASGFVLNGELGFDNAGSAVAGLGDINGDARSEIAIGARNSDPFGLSNAGRSYVQFGTSATAAINLSSITAGTSGFTINGESASGRVGRALGTAGDTNGDGLADLIVGAYSHSTSAGSAYVITGRPSTENVNTSSLAAGFSGRVFRGEALSEAGRSVAGAGDVNGDGYPDFIIGAPAFNTSTGRVYVVHGTPFDGCNEGATFRSFLRGGAVSNLVGTGDVQSGSYPPESRVALGYNAGISTSTETATITRSKTGVGGFNPAALANVRWELGTTRSGWATATVRFYYTNDMIAGLTEANLTVYRAASLAGPWTPLATTVTSGRNFATATTSTLGHFVLATSAPDSSAPTAGIVLSDATTTDLDAVRFAVTFNEPVAPTFTAADVTVTGTLTGGTVVGVGGTDPNYIVTVRAVNPGANGTLGITIGTGVTDAVGNAYAGGASTNYTIANFGRADINKDSVVNVADVTALANHIVNGDPLP